MTGSTRVPPVAAARTSAEATAVLRLFFHGRHELYSRRDNADLPSMEYAKRGDARTIRQNPDGRGTFTLMLP
ncbi:hypothetical protein [Streptomyces sp. 2A115]|uniref:hypothetical protein n=1 Tax=Streptomyces sp. 2A115 TaxID=3457439 RepID=UPI003FCF5851